MLFVCHPKILHKYCLQFLLGVKMAPRETENNVYSNFWVTNNQSINLLTSIRGMGLPRSSEPEAHV